MPKASSTATRRQVVTYDPAETAPPPLDPAVVAMTEAEVERRALDDPDAGAIPLGFWDDAVVVEPEGTTQITLRLPKRVLRHFKATGRGYHSRISAVLASYVDAQARTKA